MPFGPAFDPGPAADPRGIPGDDLAWAAYRYVADAMDRLEVDAFEQRLIEDQVAREAVAAAVDQLGALAIVARELSHEVRARPPGRPVRTRNRWGRSAVVAVALAAGFLLIAWWGTADQPRSGADQAAAVAAAWTSLRGELAPPEGTLPFPPESGGGESVPAAPDAGGTEIAEVPAEQPLPSWIMAAVAPGANPANPAPEGH